tara:strand:- start:1 stop:747 length:747 start_codon:yes stop_codon:yes gene_type:complete
MNRLIATTALAMLVGTTPLASQTVMTDDERSAFRAEVRSYLLENPEVLMEAIAVLEQRRAESAAVSEETLLQVNADDIFNDPASWVGGNPDGDITIVEFMDYRCGYCKKAYSEVNELLSSDGNIRFIVKEFPILGEQSDLASRFAISVLQTEGAETYAKTHDALMTMRNDVTPEVLARIAADFGFSDTAAVMARMTSDEVSAVIDANQALAGRLQITGTPTFVVQGTMLRGYVPLDGMRKVVAAEREG